MYPIDYANASPDVALTSLHYYFPWAIETLVKWCAFCAATGRPWRINQNVVDYFAVGDRDDLTYEEKLAEYRTLADAYHQTDLYAEFCTAALPSIRELTLDYFSSGDFDELLVQVVTATFPPHEHEEMVARHRGLVSQWAGEHAAQASPSQ